MRARVAGVLLGSLLVFFPGVSFAFDRQERFPFQPGGRLKVDVPVGEVRINGSASFSELRVRVTSRQSEPVVRQIQVRFQPGAESVLKIELPAETHRGIGEFGLETEITLPRNVHLTANLGVGDLRVSGVEGDLRVEVGVGELRLELEPELYRTVHAETGVGGLRHPFRGTHTGGWLGKRINARQREGRYKLDARVGVGELRISEPRVI